MQIDADTIRARFPNIAEACERFGMAIDSMPIPVAPAAHYHMGGVLTDLWGRTAVASLYAVGECACTGLHGANRLASNSLAECLVFASRAAEDIARHEDTSFQSHEVTPPPAFVEAPERPDAIASIAWRSAGLVRDAGGLAGALDSLDRLRLMRRPLDRPSLETRSISIAAWHVMQAALMREESRGSHYRTDFRERDDARWRARIVWNASGSELFPLASKV
jgi:L-aspartate oxidase